MDIKKDRYVWLLKQIQMSISLTLGIYLGAFIFLKEIRHLIVGVCLLCCFFCLEYLINSSKSFYTLIGFGKEEEPKFQPVCIDFYENKWELLVQIHNYQENELIERIIVYQYNRNKVILLKDLNKIPEIGWFEFSSKDKDEKYKKRFSEVLSHYEPHGDDFGF